MEEIMTIINQLHTAVLKLKKENNELKLALKIAKATIKEEEIERLAREAERNINERNNRADD